MSFMEMHVYQKGSLYSCDCAKCGATNYSHEWISDRVLNSPEEWATAVCDECGGSMNVETFYDCGRQYAGRYSADGYMDCTSWSFDTNRRRLERELRSMYGD